MANCVAFQSKLTSIMEMLARAAVLEVGRLWEDGFALVQAELRRREAEIQALNRKLAAMERERPAARTGEPPGDGEAPDSIHTSITK